MWSVANEGAERLEPIWKHGLIGLLLRFSSFNLVHPFAEQLLSLQSFWVAKQRRTLVVRHAAAARTPTSYPAIVNQPQTQKTHPVIINLSLGGSTRQPLVSADWLALVFTSARLWSRYLPLVAGNVPVQGLQPLKFSELIEWRLHSSKRKTGSEEPAEVLLSWCDIKACHLLFFFF